MNGCICFMLYRYFLCLCTPQSFHTLILYLLVTTQRAHDVLTLIVEDTLKRRQRDINVILTLFQHKQPNVETTLIQCSSIGLEISTLFQIIIIHYTSHESDYMSYIRFFFWSPSPSPSPFPVFVRRRVI